jgi:hypothetical protein
MSEGIPEKQCGLAPCRVRWKEPLRRSMGFPERPQQLNGGRYAARREAGWNVRV